MISDIGIDEAVLYIAGANCCKNGDPIPEEMKGSDAFMSGYADEYELEQIRTQRSLINGE